MRISYRDDRTDTAHNCGESFAEKMASPSAQWREQQAEAHRLDSEIKKNLVRLGFGASREDVR